MLPKVRDQVFMKICALIIAALGTAPAPAREVRMPPDQIP